MAIELSELLLGGPGHDGYTYNADVYCVSCGQSIIRELYAIEPPESIDETSDSERWPCPIFFGESDCTHHCGRCGEYLYGPRTSEEQDSAIRRAERHGWYIERRTGNDAAVMRHDGPDYPSRIIVEMDGEVWS